MTRAENVWDSSRKRKMHMENKILFCYRKNCRRCCTQIVLAHKLDSSRLRYHSSTMLRFLEYQNLILSTRSDTSMSRMNEVIGIRKYTWFSLVVSKFHSRYHGI